jgi:hypothetical protein
MIATYPFQQVKQWLPTWGRLIQRAVVVPVNTPTLQVILQPGDTYFVKAGTYRLRVLTGELWIPEKGIFGEGDRIDLRPDGQGLTLRPAVAHPAVFTLCPL